MNPDQSRFLFPYPQPTTIEQVQANLNHMQERFDRLPVFPPQYSATLSGTIPATSTWTNLGAAFTVYKDEPWTYLEFTLALNGFYNSAGLTGTFLVQAVIDGSGYGAFAEHHWNIAAVQRHDLTAITAYGGLAAGRHTIQMQAQGTAAVTADLATSYVRVLETIPLQTR